MEVISLQQNYTKPIVLCLGFFDCMHIGHVKLLSRAKQMASGKAHVALFTFSNSHFEALNRPSKLIYTFDERLNVYQSLGVDTVVAARFDNEFMATTGKDFLAQISKLNLCGVVCGADYTCGCDMLTASDVKQNLLPNNVPVEIVDLVMQGEQKACSTYVRRLLTEGKVERANAWLSQPFFYSGEVVHGRNVGQKLGFPTINLKIPDEKIVTKGVFGGICTVDGVPKKAVVNVGAQPTFGCDGLCVEAHLLDFVGNLYGKRAKVALTRYLRPIIKFGSSEQLKQQLLRDIEAVRND